MAMNSIPHAASPRARQSDLWSPLRQLATRCARAVRRYHERRALAAMSDNLLEDLGLTRGDIERVTGGSRFGAIDYRELEEARRLNRRRKHD